jgi:hypothetical protein
MQVANIGLALTAELLSAPSTSTPQVIAAHAFAKCLVNQRRKDVEAFLRASDERDADRISKKLSKALRCDSMMPGHDIVTAKATASSRQIFRGILAEALLETPGIDVSVLPAIPLRQQRYIRAWFAASQRNPAIDEMATCIADTAPADTKKLISTEPASDRERAAFAEIAPLMKQCLSANAKLVGNHQSIRAALADALYQRWINPAASLPPAEATN